MSALEFYFFVISLGISSPVIRLEKRMIDLIFKDASLGFSERLVYRRGSRDMFLFDFSANHCIRRAAVGIRFFLIFPQIVASIGAALGVCFSTVFYIKF